MQVPAGRAAMAGLRVRAAWVAAAVLLAGAGVLRAADPVPVRRPGGTLPSVRPTAGMTVKPADAARPKVQVSPAVTRLKPDMRQILKLPRTCQLEIQYELSTDGYTHYHYAPFVTWDWDKTSSKIWFRWQDTNAKTVSVVWQASAARFDDAPKNWEKPPGLLASGKVERQGQLNVFQIDFGLFAPRPGKAVMTAALALPPPPKGAAGPGHVGPAAKARALRMPTPPPPVPPGVTLTPTAGGTRNLRLTGPTSFFVRAVALDAQGAPVGYASPAIEVSWGPQQGGGTIQFVKPPEPPPAVHPAVRIAEYVPIRWSGNSYLMLCVRDVPGFTKGTVYDFTPRPKSGFDKFLDSWGGLLGFMAQVYSWVAETYNGVRNGILDGIAAVVSQIDSDLGAIARAAAEAALTTGMTALGIPPTLPSMDELAGMGTDYLAATLADQVPGLPPEAAKAAVDKMAAEMKNSYTSGANSGVLFVPDPSQRYRPAILWLEARNAGAQPTTPMDLTVTFGSYTPDWEQVGAMTGLYYPDGLQAIQVFRSRSLPLPSLAPGQVLRIPVALEESYNPDRDEQNRVQWSCWALGYHHEQNLAVNTTLANPVKGGPANDKLQQALTWVPSAPWKP